VAEVQPNTAEALVTAISALRSITHRLTILEPHVEAQCALEKIGELLKGEQTAAANIIAFDRR
jgi:hypothetical protein